MILLAPELFASAPDLVALKSTLSQPHRQVRLLVRLAAAADLASAGAMAEAGVDVQVLAPAGMNLPATRLPLVQMPTGCDDNATNDLALAFSDALLVPAPAPELPLVRLARELHKTFVIPGAALPPLAGARHGVSHRLDPEQPGWHRWLSGFWGRSEQFALELAAYNWRGRPHGSVAKSREKLRACLPDRAWRHAAFFAPEKWKTLAIDRAAIDDTSPIVAAFERLDRSALYGSFIHRDLIWYTYLAAALAVCFAVAGKIDLIPFIPEDFLSWSELAAIIFITAAIGFVRLWKLQDRWIACRSGAEQLRIARMSMPLLMLPKAFYSLDEPARGDHSKQALADIKRALRDQGLPDVSPTLSPVDATGWLAFLVEVQTTYHRDNHLKLECAERRLKWLAGIIFFLAFIGVVAHLAGSRYEGLLFFTAALPALATAAHGVMTRLGLVHRIELSRDAEAELLPIRHELHDLIAKAPDSEQAWAAVRRLAREAAEAMWQENRSWHSLVRRQRDELT